MPCGVATADRHRAECRPGKVPGASRDQQPLPTASGSPANVLPEPQGYQVRRALCETKCLRPGPTHRFRHPTRFRSARLARHRQCRRAWLWSAPAPSRLPRRRATPALAPQQNFLARSCRSKRAPVMLDWSIIQCSSTQKHDPKTPVESMTVSSSILVDAPKTKCSQVFDLLPNFGGAVIAFFSVGRAGVIREHALACDAPG